MMYKFTKEVVEDKQMNTCFVRYFNTNQVQRTGNICRILESRLNQVQRTKIFVAFGNIEQLRCVAP